MPTRRTYVGHKSSSSEELSSKSLSSRAAGQGGLGDTASDACGEYGGSAAPAAAPVPSTPFIWIAPVAVAGEPVARLAGEAPCVKLAWGSLSGCGSPKSMGRHCSRTRRRARAALSRAASRSSLAFRPLAQSKVRLTALKLVSSSTGDISGLSSSELAWDCRLWLSFALFVFHRAPRPALSLSCHQESRFNSLSTSISLSRRSDCSRLVHEPRPSRLNTLIRSALAISSASASAATFCRARWTQPSS
mmetsp:Transcript_89064/g.241561  ORF Transcript_89064/g.241561 Transcript_89064/m.241561 type:complete len:247 (+) Transcript_89064:1626-2366(+)